MAKVHLSSRPKVIKLGDDRLKVVVAGRTSQIVPLAVGSVITQAGDIPIGGVGGPPTAKPIEALIWRSVKDPRYGAVMNGTTDDGAALDAAVAAAAAAGGGTVFVPPGVLAFSGQRTIPQSVSLVGTGSGTNDASSASELKGLNAGAQVYVAGGANGSFSHIRVNGNGIATNPVRIGPVAQYTFIGLGIDGAAAGGAGLTLEGTQNSLFAGLTVFDCVGDGIVLTSDVGGLEANSNVFQKFEVRSCRGNQIKFTSTGAAATDTPFNNVFIGGIVEDFAGAGIGALNAIYHGAGDSNAFVQCLLINRSVPGAGAVVKMRKDGVPNSTNLIVDSCSFAGITGAAGTTAIDLGASTRVTLYGRNSFNALNQLWFVAVGAAVSRVYDEIGLGTVTTYFASPDGGAENTLLRAETISRYRITRFSTSDDALEILVSGETQPRLRLRAGNIFFGDGVSALDAGLERDSANVIRTFAGDSFKSSSHLEIDGDLNHDGTLVGFNAATPVGKRTLGAAATDAATTQTLANNLRQALIDLGLGQT